VHKVQRVLLNVRYLLCGFLLQGAGGRGRKESSPVASTVQNSSWIEDLDQRERKLFKEEVQEDYTVVQQRDAEFGSDIQSTERSATSARTGVASSQEDEMEKMRKQNALLLRQLEESRKEKEEMAIEMRDKVASDRRVQVQTLLDKGKGGRGGLGKEASLLGGSSNENKFVIADEQSKKKQKAPRKQAAKKQKAVTAVAEGLSPEVKSDAGGIPSGIVGGVEGTITEKCSVVEAMHEAAGMPMQSLEGDNALPGNRSFDTGTTETEPEDDVAMWGQGSDEEEGGISSSSSVSSNEYPVMIKIRGGFVEKEGERRCMLTIQYEADLKEGLFRNIPARLAVEDDPSHRILKWIIENKRRSAVWRDQVVAGIEATLDKGLYEGWEGWEPYIRKRIEDGFLAEKCRRWLEGGSHREARRTYVEVDATESPVKKKDLKKREAICNVTGVHDWKTERNGAYARKGGKKALTLTGVTCDGVEGKMICGKEFVEKLEDAINPGWCIVVSNKTPCKWCKDCKMALCVPCHDVLIGMKVKRCCRPRKLLDC
jgi:hypothetical protein